MRHYNQLTLEQRYEINILLKTEHNQSEIAQALGVHKTTVKLKKDNMIKSDHVLTALPGIL